MAVVDTGLEIGHEDLSANVVPGASANFLNGGNNPTNDNQNPNFYPDHGTSVGGLIAARAGNGKGIQGVAGAASLVGYNFLQAQTLSNFISATGGAAFSSDVSVFNQSFGFSPSSPEAFDSTEDSIYANGVATLRNGKGAIYVKSAGNSFSGSGTNCTKATSGASHPVTCENASSDPDNVFPWQIIVAATNGAGTRASYSTAGSAIWVSGIGGEFGIDGNNFSCVVNNTIVPCTSPAIDPAMVTTDQSGCNQGYSITPTKPTDSVPNLFDYGGTSTQLSLNPTCNYTSGFNGTSSAAPIVSGVVALLLEANPNLDWRQVKYILATTADNDATLGAAGTNLAYLASTKILGDSLTYTLEPGWIQNHASPISYRFSNWFGFGRVNATAALAAAVAPPSVGTLKTYPTSGFADSLGLSLVIPNNSTAGVTSTLNVTTSGITFIEAVQIEISATHPNVGELSVELTSPGNTNSVVLNAYNSFWGYTGGFVDLPLLSNAFYGEGANGTWTIKVVDVDNTTSSTGQLTNWKLRIYGR